MRLRGIVRVPFEAKFVLLCYISSFKNAFYQSF